LLLKPEKTDIVLGGPVAGRRWKLCSVFPSGNTPVELPSCGGEPDGQKPEKGELGLAKRWLVFFSVKFLPRVFDFVSESQTRAWASGEALRFFVNSHPKLGARKENVGTQPLLLGLVEMAAFYVIPGPGQ